MSLSGNRTIVKTIHKYIQPHVYLIGGILESDPFSASELSLALRVLEPRPQVLLVDRGCSDAETDEARKIFAEYMKDIDVGSGIVFKITSKVFNEVDKEGWWPRRHDSLVDCRNTRIRAGGSETTLVVSLSC